MEPSPPHCLFLFGLAGAGKTYLGRLIAERFGYTAYDLDSDLTPEMREAIAAKLPYTEEMRDEFFDVVIRRIAELKVLHPRLVLMQAAYKERHRIKVRQAYPEIQFVWVDAPLEIIQQRLTARRDAISPEYALSIMANFEPPCDLSMRLVNDLSAHDDLARRFEELLRAPRG